jgi:hypothetical protein
MTKYTEKVPTVRATFSVKMSAARQDPKLVLAEGRYLREPTPYTELLSHIN